jgi:hypothetical protein
MTSGKLEVRKMADDDMKRWLGEAAKAVQAPKGFSHARTKPVVVEKLKTRSRHPTDGRMKKQSRRSEDGTPQSN